MAASAPTVSEVVETLCLFDEAMLNTRYQGLLMRDQSEETTAELAALPTLVLESARLAREGAVAWDRKATDTVGFIAWAQHTVLEAFLELTESQLRVAAHMARCAPDASTRAPFDAMCARHRHVANTLRKALKTQARPEGDKEIYRRNVQEEEANGDFRSQIEQAARDAEASGSGVRHIVLSPTGLRHLRDQGCFRDGRPYIRGHPVSVDFGWDAPAFVIETFDRVGLDEILAVNAPGPGPSALE